MTMLLADTSALDSLVLHFFFDGVPDGQLPEGPGGSSGGQCVAGGP